MFYSILGHRLPVGSGMYPDVAQELHPDPQGKLISTKTTILLRTCRQRYIDPLLQTSPESFLQIPGEVDIDKDDNLVTYL